MVVPGVVGAAASAIGGAGAAAAMGGAVTTTSSRTGAVVSPSPAGTASAAKYPLIVSSTWGVVPPDPRKTPVGSGAI